MTHEVAYKSQLATRRAELHAAAARAIEQLDADKLDDRAALLAYHWEQAGEPQENIVIATSGLGICAYLAGGTSGVPVPDLRRTCVEGVEIAEALGNRNTQVCASWALAIAHFLNGDCDIAEARLRESLAEAHLAGTGLESQGYMLAVFADSCRARGDAETAIARAREAVELTDAGGFRFQAALGRAALADALVHAGAPAHEIAEVIAAARAIVEETGGNSLLPRLREAEVRLAARSDSSLLAAGLREAEATYRALGAPDPADRLARELAA